MDPATIAAVASIGGAAIDFFSGERSARKSRKHTKKVATDEAYGSVMGRVEAAKAAGLHPLAALGVPSSSGANVGAGMTDFSSVAQNVTNNYTQQRQWRAEQELARAQITDSRNAAQRAEARENARTNAELSHVQAQNDWIQEQIRASREESVRRNLQATKPLTVPIRTTSQKPQMPDQYIAIKDRNGGIQYIPNPEIYDLELPTIVGAGTLIKPEVQQGSWMRRKWEELKAADRARRANPYNLPPSIE